jgi:hypothetical protein
LKLKQNLGLQLLGDGVDLLLLLRILVLVKRATANLKGVKTIIISVTELLFLFELISSISSHPISDALLFLFNGTLIGTFLVVSIV